MIQIEMQMPKSCASCDFLKVYAKKDHFKCIPDGRYLYDEDKIWMTEKRPNWCPLKGQDERYKNMVISWLREIALNNADCNRNMTFLDAIEDILDRASNGLEQYFRDKQEGR